jgi:hypothetical protein
VEERDFDIKFNKLRQENLFHAEELYNLSVRMIQFATARVTGRANCDERSQLADYAKSAFVSAKLITNTYEHLSNQKTHINAYCNFIRTMRDIKLE